VSGAPGNLKERARAELRSYLIVSAYLYVCFGAVLLHEAALLRGQGLAFETYGLAAVKALIIGKFILLGDAAGIGTRPKFATVLTAVAGKTALFLLLLLLLSLVEELVVGRLHGRGFAATIEELLHGSPLALLAKCLLMTVVLIPLLAAREIDRALQPGGLRGLLQSEPGDHRHGPR
jgi:hypothetical protein